MSQSFWQIRISAPAGDIFDLGDRLEALAGDSAPTISFVDFDDGSGLWACEGLFTAKEPAERTLDALQALVTGGDDADAAVASVAEMSLNHLEPRDWVAHVQRQLSPVAAGPFLIHGRHDSGTVPARRTRLLIDAGQAFGTAHHPTTTGCLEAIAWCAARAPALTAPGSGAHRSTGRRRGLRIADIGTGTGILAIAAHRVSPAARITATDIDPIAVAVARANARNNSVADRLTCLVADGVTAASVRDRGPYDIVIANILAGPLKAMAQGIASICRPGSTVILSGILDWQHRSVIARYRAAGCTVERVYHRQGWTTLVLRRGSDRKQ
ncbi:MAG: 50S ribosomal protein L11 methyltransferase [Pseudomonadota bacterium]